VTSVLVTDASYKHALAAIRNLADHGLRVVAASARGQGRVVRGFLSRYADARFVYPPPESAAREFVTAVAEAVKCYEVDVILPIGEAAVVALSQYGSELPSGVAVPITSWDEGMPVAADKRATLEFAATRGVPVPRSYRHAGEIDSYPVVIKPRSGSGFVRYARDSGEVRSFLGSDDLCEEYIPGDGYAFFGLYDRGVERAFFMHHRVREYPVTGGPSTAAESFFDPVLHELGSRLLRELRWHGVAMVEFKRDRRDGLYKLMEINPKFWGSLDLAIAAGVEFPWLAVRLALGEPLGEVPAYATPLRFQWIFEDLLHVCARPSSAPAFLRDLLSRNVRNDFRRDDLRPFLASAVNMAARLGRSRPRGMRRFPESASSATRRATP